MFFLLKTTLKTGRYQASTVHMSPPGFGMCRLLVWPHVLSWFCHVSFFLFGHMFFPGTSTCLFPIYNPRAIFLFCTRVLYKFSHMAFICLAACQFTICTRVHFFCSCMSNSDHHVSKTWMLHMSIYYMWMFI